MESKNEVKDVKYARYMRGGNLFIGSTRIPTDKYVAVKKEIVKVISELNKRKMNKYGYPWVDVRDTIPTPEELAKENPFAHVAGDDLKNELLKKEREVKLLKQKIEELSKNEELVEQLKAKDAEIESLKAKIDDLMKKQSQPVGKKNKDKDK